MDFGRTTRKSGGNLVVLLNRQVPKLLFHASCLDNVIQCDIRHTRGLVRDNKTQQGYIEVQAPGTSHWQPAVDSQSPQSSLSLTCLGFSSTSSPPVGFSFFTNFLVKVSSLDAFLIPPTDLLFLQMHSTQTSASASSFGSPCTCDSLPAQLSRTPVSRCMKIVVSTGGGSYMVDKVDCGSSCCRTSSQYAAAQVWMGGLDK